MIVVGGTYLEVCLRPEWRRLFGSGLRAASAVARLSPGTVLYTYGFEDWKDDIEHSAGALGCEANVRPIKDAISFSYDHPLSGARQHPPAPKQNPSLNVQGRTVLRFGFVEGDAMVDAGHAVFDPQSCGPSVSFESNGSTAEHLAVVLNEDEVIAAGCESPAAVQGLMNHHGAETVVIKRGPRGATVHSQGGSTSEIRPYWSNSVFKIGSGDVFSAAFALFWGERGMDAGTAADLASRSVAQFVEGHVLPLDDAERDIERPAVETDAQGRIYLAGPFFDLAQRWMIEETLRTLTRLGVDVFSPLHEVGMSHSAAEIAQADLQGLRDCSKVLALLDGMDPGNLRGRIRAGAEYPCRRSCRKIGARTSHHDPRIRMRRCERLHDGHLPHTLDGRPMRVLLFSGGLDSSALAFWKRPDICLTVDYGQRPARGEIAAASLTASEFASARTCREWSGTAWASRECSNERNDQSSAHGCD